MDNTPVWEDTFDDGMRAATSLLIQLSQEQPSWMSWWQRRRLRRGAYPWAYMMVTNARVGKLLAPGVPRSARVIQDIR